MLIGCMVFISICIGIVGFVLPYFALRESKATRISREIINSFDIKEDEDNLDEMIAYFEKNGLPKYKID